MAFYYVKNNGTATGDAGRHATKQTGSFAALGTANYYASLTAAEAATTAPTAGDFILVSDIHDHVPGAAISYTGVTSGAPFMVLAVSDTAIDAARGGTRGKETASTDLTFGGNIALNGMEFFCGDDFITTVSRAAYLEDCKLRVTATGDGILMGDGANFHLVNCELAWDIAGAAINIGGAGLIVMYGGSVTTTSAGITSLIIGTANNGGAVGRFTGVDLTDVTGTLVNGMGANSGTDDLIDFSFHRCKLASGVAFVGEALNSFNQRVLLTQCSSASSDAEYQYFLKTFSGTVEDDDVIRRADDEPFTDSATDVSYKAITNSQCGIGFPLWFDFPTPRWSALSAGATDTLRLYFASATSGLTKNDLWVELVYPDGTNKQTPNFLSTREFPLDAGTTHTTDSGSDWRNGGSPLAGQTEYLLDVDTSGDVGADSYPFVRVHISKASITVNIASEFDLV